MKNLYEYFNAKDEKELFDKILRKDEEVKELIDYFEFIKKEKLIEKQTLASFKDLTKYLAKLKIESDENLIIFFMDSKLNLRAIQKIDLNAKSFKDKIKEVYKNSLNLPVNSVFIIMDNRKALHDSKVKNLNLIQDTLKTLGLEVYDVLKLEKDDAKSISFYSKAKNELVKLDKNSDIKSLDEETKRYENLNNLATKDFRKLKGYNEFSSFYAFNMLKGLNYQKDFTKIKNYLKIMLQFKSAESFGLIAFSPNNNIIGVDIVNTGDSNTCITDFNASVRILFDYGASNMAIFHNHPSGDTCPSKEDVNLTKIFKERLEIINSKLLDHFIIGTDKVLSFSEDKAYKSFISYEKPSTEKSISHHEDFYELDEDIKNMLLSSCNERG